MSSPAPSSVNSTLAPTFVDACFFNESKKPDHLLFVGIGLVLCCSIMANIGLVVQKQALNRERDRLDSSRSVKFYMVKRWWLGFSIFLASQVVSP